MRDNSGKQLFGFVPGQASNTPGPLIALFGNANGHPGNDELTSVLIQHRGYGHGDTSFALGILENADTTNTLGTADAGYDTPNGPPDGYATQAMVGLAETIGGKAPAARVQAGEGVQYAFTEPHTPSQTLRFTAASVDASAVPVTWNKAGSQPAYATVSFSPPIPAAASATIRPRDQIETNSLDYPPSGDVPPVPDHWVGQVMQVDHDEKGGISRILVNGWTSTRHPSFNNAPPSQTGTPVIVTAGAGYKPGDVVAMNTRDGHHAAEFTVDMVRDVEGRAPTAPPGPKGQVWAISLKTVHGGRFSEPDGRFTQTGSTGFGTGLVIDLNPAVWIDTNNAVFGRNTACVIQEPFGVSYLANYCVGEEIDVINDLGDVHHYDASGNATDSLLSINPTAGYPFMFKGIDVMSLGNNAMSYGFLVNGDTEAGFISGGARQYGFAYIPTAPKQSANATSEQFFSHSAGFLSRQWFGPAFTVLRADTNSSVPTFNVDAASGSIATQGSLALGVGATNNAAGTIRGVFPGAAPDAGRIQHIAAEHDFYDPTGAHVLSIILGNAGPALSTGAGQTVTFESPAYLARGARPPVTTVSALPPGCLVGQIAYALDGRKPSDPAGRGTGVPVSCVGNGTGSTVNSTGSWLSDYSHAAVAK